MRIVPGSRLSNVDGHALRRLRLAKGLTAAGLADVAHVRLEEIALLEVGEHIPTGATVRALAEALETSLAELLVTEHPTLAQLRVDMNVTPKEIQERWDYPSGFVRKVEEGLIPIGRRRAAQWAKSLKVEPEQIRHAADATRAAAGRRLDPSCP